MRYINMPVKYLSYLLLALAGLFPACEFSDSTDNYKISLMVVCNGGTDSNNFSVQYYIDNEYILSEAKDGTDVTISLLPLGKKEKVTVTATKEDTTSSMTILVYKDGKIDKFSNLASCTTGTYSTCSNTLVLAYDVDDSSNLTKTASTTTDSDSSSTSTSTDTTE
jgi:hypothetical protein